MSKRKEDLVRWNIYDENGDVRRRLRCRYPDPGKPLVLGIKTITQYPSLVVSSHDPEEAECLRVDGWVPDNAGAYSVDPDMCALKLACGECPIGFSPEAVK